MKSSKNSSKMMRRPVLWLLVSWITRAAVENGVVNLLLAGLGKQVNSMVEEQVQLHMTPLIKQVRRITVGILLIFLSTSVWFVTALGLLLSLFLSLSPHPELVHAGLITTGASAAIGLLLLLAGIRLVR